jgi:hypothetical protein
MCSPLTCVSLSLSPPLPLSHGSPRPDRSWRPTASRRLGRQYHTDPNPTRTLEPLCRPPSRWAAPVTPRNVCIVPDVVRGLAPHITSRPRHNLDMHEKYPSERTCRTPGLGYLVRAPSVPSLALAYSSRTTHVLDRELGMLSLHAASPDACGEEVLRVVEIL